MTDLTSTANYKIQVGLRSSGYVEYESEVLPEYRQGMVFIASCDGSHYAFNIQEVCGVSVHPARSTQNNTTINNVTINSPEDK